MMIDLEFQKAQELVKRLAYRPSNERMLQLYAYFKQATAGDCLEAQPSANDLAARAKHDAWEKAKGLTRDSAMKKYVELVHYLAAKRSQVLI